MKRIHLSINVTNLDESVEFYAHLFGEAPSELHEDLAKWRLTNPPLNFALSARGGTSGVDHVGIQAESTSELGQMRQRISSSDAPRIEQGKTTCCYASSDKTWVIDPQSVPWEIFHTHGLSDVFGESGALDSLRAEAAAETSCCRPAIEK